MDNKPHVIKDYNSLDSVIQERIKLFYPEGFEQHLIKFTNKDGNYVSALPFETDDHYYLVRMSVIEAQGLIEDDDDYDDDGSLRDDIKSDYEEKHQAEDEEGAEAMDDDD